MGHPSFVVVPAKCRDPSLAGLRFAPQDDSRGVVSKSPALSHRTREGQGTRLVGRESMGHPPMCRAMSVKALPSRTEREKGGAPALWSGSMCSPPSAGEFAEEVGFVHAVLEGFASVDEDDGDFVGELAAELFVAVDVDILPGEAATAMQFGEGLFDDLAEVTSFAGVDHDLSGLGHWGEFSKGGEGFPAGGGFLPKSTSRREVFLTVSAVDGKTGHENPVVGRWFSVLRLRISTAFFYH